MAKLVCCLIAMGNEDVNLSQMVCLIKLNNLCVGTAIECRAKIWSLK